MAKLYYIYAPMNSSKSAILLMKAHSFDENNISYLCLKSTIDTRDGDDMIVSRIGLKHECLSVAPTDDIYQIISTYNNKLELLLKKTPSWLLVDEAQFLTKEQVDQLSKIVDNLDINVMCYGLRTDFKGELFDGSKRLFEISDNIEELKINCCCGRKAIINARFDSDGNIITNGDKIFIGGNSIYKPICRKCYSDLIKKQG